MSAIHRLALICAAHNHVAIEDTKQASLDLFYTLKSKSEDDACMRVDQFGSTDIPGQYDLLTVLELVELIEHEASELVLFSESILNAAQSGLLGASTEPGFELDASGLNLKSFAETELATQQGEALIAQLTAMHPEKRWGLYPLTDYCQYAEVDAPDMLVSFGCAEQQLDSGLVDPCSTMTGELCKPAAWGLSEEAARHMKEFNKVNMAKYPLGDGPRAA